MDSQKLDAILCEPFATTALKQSQSTWFLKLSWRSMPDVHVTPLPKILPTGLLMKTCWNNSEAITLLVNIFQVVRQNLLACEQGRS